MEFIDVLAKMDERLARQDEILARMDERTLEHSRILERLGQMIDLAREESLAAHQSSTRVLMRMHEWDGRIERALSAIEQTVRRRGGPQA